MNGNAEDRLLRLLPSAYRRGDGENVLADLLGPIAAQLRELESDIERLYANQFIETCEPWAIPYIGDLVEETPFSADGLRAALARREVANAVAARRRKGTLGVLEQLAWETMEMPATAVELCTRLAVTQRLGLPRPNRGRTLSLRSRAAVADTRARTYGIGEQSPASPRIVAIHLYAGRIREARQPTSAVGGSLVNRRFAPFDTKLFVRPAAAHFPRPMARDSNLVTHYGVDRAFRLWRATGLVAAADVRFADLRHWPSPPADETVLVDPELGRIVSRTPIVEASFHHGLPGWANEVSQALQVRGKEVALQNATVRPSTVQPLLVPRDTQRLVISRCVLGPIRVEEGRDGPLAISIADSIWDGGGGAVLDSGGNDVHLTVRRATLLGPLDENQVVDIADSVSSVNPAAVMESTVFGARGYARLDRRCGAEILGGAADGGEIGAFHDELFHERLSRLRSRLEDFVPPGWAVQIHLSDIDVVPPEQEP